VSLRVVRENLADIPLLAFYGGPHPLDGAAPDDALPRACHTFQPGVLFRAASELRIDWERAWLVADMLDDIEAATAPGCRTILINNGHEIRG
jgi:phosphoglycolate phosphatase-like HAD superfamily hydrolase